MSRMKFGGIFVRAVVTAAVTAASLPALVPSAAHADVPATRCTPEEARYIYDAQVVVRKALRTDAGRRYGVVRIVAGHRPVDALGSPVLSPDQRVLCVDLRVDDAFEGRAAEVVSRLKYGDDSSRRRHEGVDDVLHDSYSTAGLRTGTIVTLRVRVEGAHFDAVKFVKVRYPRVPIADPRSAQQ